MLQIYEVDGSTETSTQARNIRNNALAKIEERSRPGLGLDSSPNGTGGSGPTPHPVELSLRPVKSTANGDPQIAPLRLAGALYSGKRRRLARRIYTLSWGDDLVCRR